MLERESVEIEGDFQGFAWVHQEEARTTIIQDSR